MAPQILEPTLIADNFLLNDELADLNRLEALNPCIGTLGEHLPVARTQFVVSACKHVVVPVLDRGVRRIAGKKRIEIMRVQRS